MSEIRNVITEDWSGHSHGEVEDALKDKLSEMEQSIEEAAQAGYAPPDGGIPKKDLSQSVQDTLDSVADKVDKEDGKGLSANDYTDAEKDKLSGLQNYDDTALQSAINRLQSALDTLIGSGNVQGVIDTFNEVTAFLNGIDTDDPTLANQLLALTNSITAVQTSLSTKANSADVYSKSEVEQMVVSGAVSVTTNQDGTFTIHSGETDYTINLNHTHEGMAKLVVDTASNLPDASEMENGTIYGELDDGEIATIYLGGYPFYGGGASSGPVLRRPADGATIDMGQTTSGTVSKTINVKGKNLTQALIIQLTGTGYSFGTTQPSEVTRDSATQLTIPASSISAVNSLNGVDIVVVYTGNDTDEDASGTLGITSASPDSISTEATLVANKVVYEDLAGVKLTGTQWLQTDYKPTSTTQFVMKVKFSDNENSNILYGSDVGSYILSCPQNNETGGSEKFLLYNGSNSTVSNKVYKGCSALLLVNRSGVSDAGAVQQIQYSDSVSEEALFLTDESIIKFENVSGANNGGKLSFLPGGNTGKNVTTSHKWYTMQSPMRIGLSPSDVIYSVFDLTIYELTFTEDDTNNNRHYIPKSKNGVPGLYETNTGAFISSMVDGEPLVAVPLQTNNN